MADVKCCPVCNGRGIVRSDFYTLPVRYPNIPITTTVSDAPVTCRSCDGKGVILVPDYIPNSLTPTWTCNTLQMKDLEYLNQTSALDTPDNHQTLNP